MKLKSMQATFGRLDRKKLDLQPGLNVISGGNETGKTTWAEFLTAMLYGVDTRARGKGAELPVKTKYEPWNGSPMEGRIEVEWQGRSVVLERTSALTPLGTLRASDAATGLPVPELTAASCGEALTGVTEPVFQRSALLRQRGAAISSDPELEKRLSGLVTAGSEDYAYGEVADKLKKLQNALQYNQSGILPRLRSEIGEIDQTLDKAADLRKRQNNLLGEIRTRQAEEAELARINAALERRERARLRRAAADSRQRLSEAQSERETLAAACEKLPDAETLESLQAKVRQLEKTVQTAKMEDSMSPVEFPDEPERNPFRHYIHMTPDEIKTEDERFEASLRQVREAETMPKLWKLSLRSLAGMLLGLLPILCGCYFRDRLNELHPALFWVLFGLGCAVILGVTIWHFRTANRITRAKKAAFEILQKFGCESADQLHARAAELRREIDGYRAARADAEETAAGRKLRDDELREKTDVLLGELALRGAVCPTLEDAEAWIQDGLRSRQDLERATRTERQRAEQYSLLKEHEGEGEAEEELNAELNAYDPAMIRDRLSRSREAIIPLRSEADRLAGSLQQLGDPLRLEAEREEKQARLARLDQRYAAMQLARKELARADETLRERFAPLLCKKAGELFYRLTEGKYDRVTLDRAMRVTVHSTDSTTDRSLSYLSGGTVDQLYLALRLAICDLLLPDCPIILDDALVYFDDERLRVALEVLRELGRQRQILLFTCTDREKRMLDASR